MKIRHLTANDFFLLYSMDWSPLPRERDSIYLTLSVGQSACSYIAEEAGELLGVILCTRSCDGLSVYVNHIRVSEPARGKGVGGKLLLRLERWAGRAGVKRIWLLCQDETVGWYRERGYRENGAFLTPEIRAYLRETKKVHVFQKKM